MKEIEEISLILLICLEYRKSGDEGNDLSITMTEITEVVKKNSAVTWPLEWIRAKAVGVVGHTSATLHGCKTLE